ncbi:MAG: bifunctional phosphoribosylaminoimidazolecarboxamide formyltransferase/IMP cyclohydrolase [Acidobacteriota bacterium]|nr:bifunctional phosphoribosylaminoimidazolecarboxamide formyltransferase/IMP cyclohydrolase [Acidobacteriota bacterium]
MTENNDLGLRAIRRALISVSDKTGIVEFAHELRRFDVEIISTGGTARVLHEAGIEVRDISEVTGFPEMMDGRVKTLHPRIHGALLALRDNPEHQSAMREQGIEPIDMVVVNLYPFEQTVARDGVTLDEAIEQIDIGGPAMVRSSAKNFHDVAVVVSPALYRKVADEVQVNRGALLLSTRARLARLAFLQTAKYDRAIVQYLSSTVHTPGENLLSDAALDEVGQHFGASRERVRSTQSPRTEVVRNSENQVRPHAQDSFSDGIVLSGRKLFDLRYGENPHQKAALYSAGEAHGIAHAELLGGKEMSFNNYVDTDAAWQLVCDFEETACAIIKHTNPAGVGQGVTAEEAYRKALATDPLSAFGGIVAFNRTVDEEAATAVTEIFTEVIIAPEYTTSALEILRAKKKLRVLCPGTSRAVDELEYRQISGGMLVQTRDTHRLTKEDLQIVSKRQPTEEEIRSLLFAWIVCKHTKSNAIVYARDGQTVGVGAGQMSRVDSVKIGAMRAQLPLHGSVLASDAFFPFRDGIDEAAKQGISAVIQPGGSMRDAEVIAAADEHGITMVFTGIRHFKH